MKGSFFSRENTWRFATREIAGPAEPGAEAETLVMNATVGLLTATKNHVRLMIDLAAIPELIPEQKRAASFLKQFEITKKLDSARRLMALTESRYPDINPSDLQLRLGNTLELLNLGVVNK